MPAMSRLCAVGAALVAQVGAQSFDWDKYMSQYAGDYYKGSMTGEYAGFVDRYAKGYATDEKGHYVGQYSKDRVAQAKQFQGKYEGQYAGDYEGKYAGSFQDKYASGYEGKSAPAGAAPQVLAAMAAVAPGGNASAAEFAAMHSSEQQAEASITQLEQWDAKLVQDLQDKDFAETVAKGIIAKVQSTFLSQHDNAAHSFDDALHKLDPSTLSKADSSEVHDLEHTAKEALEQMKRVDREEFKAMKSTLRSIQKAGKVKAKTLWKDARKAAHQVLKLGMRAAKDQRKEGERERVYEKSMLDAEMHSEHLSLRAEEAAEGAENLVEKQGDKVELHLEALMEGLHKSEGAEYEAHAEKLRAAKAAVQQAREAAQSPAPAPPAVFLARSSSADFSGALIAPLACVAMLVAMLSFLALRFWRGSVAIGRPLLG